MRIIAVFTLFLSLGLADPLLADSSQPLRLRIFPQNAQVFVQGNRIASSPESDTVRDFDLPSGTTRVSFASFGWEPTSLDIPSKVLSGSIWSVKLEPLGSLLRPAGEFSVGLRPRALAFSSDSSRLVVATSDGLLGYTLQGVPIKGINQDGFFSDVTRIAKTNEIWALRDDGTLLVLSGDSLAVKAKFSWGATGNGVIDPMDAAHLAVVSWDQQTIIPVDLASHLVGQPLQIGDLATSLAPIPTSSGGGWAVTEFQNGAIDWFNADGSPNGRTRVGGSPRALATTQSLLWIANMETGKLTALDLGARTVHFSVDLGPNPQTLSLSPDVKTLAVALRGTNNPLDYTKPGPDYGKVVLVDAQKGDILGYVWGREQPMGLAWSPDGKWLAFTDYLSDDVEIYRVTR